MPGRSASVKTLVGLPIFLVVALGLAFGASFVSRTLRQDPTLHANENVSATTNTTNTNSSTSEQYDFALATMTAAIYQRMTQSAVLTNIAANQVSAVSAARVVLSGVCWLANNPNDLQFFPVGTVQQDFTTMIALYASTSATETACYSVTADAQLQASRLMTLDDDGDSLNAIAEYWYDTNQFSKDTDNDTFRDDEEIANGFNPLGSSNAQP